MVAVGQVRDGEGPVASSMSPRLVGEKWLKKTIIVCIGGEVVCAVLVLVVVKIDMAYVTRVRTGDGRGDKAREEENQSGD